MWIIYKVFIEFIITLLLFYFFIFYFFGCKACGILALQTKIILVLPALEGEILTTGPPQKSHEI